MSAITNIPVYLSAKTKDDLMAVMLQNNMANGVHYNYQTPLFDGKNWVVWFFADITHYKKNIIGEQVTLANDIKKAFD